MTASRHHPTIGTPSGEEVLLARTAAAKEDGRDLALRLGEALAELLPSATDWTERRLPRWARRRVDACDLVQDAALALLRHAEKLAGASPRAIRAYLLRTLHNRICDEVRRAGKVEVRGLAHEPAVADRRSSPLADAIAREQSRRYRVGLLQLSSGERELVQGRYELGLSYRELADRTGHTTADAARMAARRAVARLEAAASAGA